MGRRVRDLDQTRRLMARTAPETAQLDATANYFSVNMLQASADSTRFGGCSVLGPVGGRIASFTDCKLLTINELYLYVPVRDSNATPGGSLVT
jgi:hypothetical protein